MGVANETVTLVPGAAVYLKPSVIHGIDSLGDEPLHTMLIFMDKVIDEWTPVEDIYTDI